MLYCMIQRLFPREKKIFNERNNDPPLIQLENVASLYTIVIESEKAADTIKMFQLIKTPDRCGSAFVRKHDTKNHSMYRCNKLCTQRILKTKVLNLRAPRRDLLASSSQSNNWPFPARSTSMKTISLSERALQLQIGERVRECRSG